MDLISENEGVHCLGDVSPEKMSAIPSDGTENDPSIANAPESKSVGFSTPLNQKNSTTEVEQLDTFEAIIATLESGVVDFLTEGAEVQRNSSTSAKTTANNLNGLVAKVWVVRYVDYTSKYGLGFLFNTGSAGVYFNDSTKIVLSADGAVFQYTERRDSQKHLIRAYPTELQKKVTLLIHFRDFLMEQERLSDGTGAMERDSSNLMQKSFENLAFNGACSSIQFGESSTSLVCDAERDQDPEMPFLQKWVRTKRAVLFRVSNRTVQIVFFDGSQVLLYSHGRVITFVSKLGERTEHTLQEVLKSGTLFTIKCYQCDAFSSHGNLQWSH